MANHVNREIARSARRWHVPPAILNALLIQESGKREGLTSSAGARDIAQFMPVTARGFGVHLGDGRTADDIDGAAHYLHNGIKQTGSIKSALSIYNSGRADAYKDPGFAGGQTYNYVRNILSIAKRDGFKGGGAGGARGGGGAPGHFVPGGTINTRFNTTVQTFDRKGYEDAKRLSVLGAYLLRHDPNSQLLKFGIVPTEAPDLADFQGTRTQGHLLTRQGPGRFVGGGGGGRASAGGAGGAHGRVTIAPGANRPGVGVHGDIFHVAQAVAGVYGRPLTLTTGTNHSQMTTSGNQSDHWTGHAGDFAARGRKLTDMATAALLALGRGETVQWLRNDGAVVNVKITRKNAVKYAAQGGIFNVPYRGRRVQVIANTHQGGDHTNHLHLGIDH